MQQIVAFLVMIDGIISAVWGLGFLRWLRPRLPKFLHPILNLFFYLPESLFRIGAVGQAVIGWWWLRKEQRFD